MGYIRVFDNDKNDNDDLAITTAQLFLWNRQANKKVRKLFVQIYQAMHRQSEIS